MSKIQQIEMILVSIHYSESNEETPETTTTEKGSVFLRRQCKKHFFILQVASLISLTMRVRISVMVSFLYKILSYVKCEYEMQTKLIWQKFIRYKALDVLATVFERKNNCAIRI